MLAAGKEQSKVLSNQCHFSLLILLLFLGTLFLLPAACSSSKEKPAVPKPSRKPLQLLDRSQQESPAWLQYPAFYWIAKKRLYFINHSFDSNDIEDAIRSMKRSRRYRLRNAIYIAFPKKAATNVSVEQIAKLGTQLRTEKRYWELVYSPDSREQILFYAELCSVPLSSVPLSGSQRKNFIRKHSRNKAGMPKTIPKTAN